MYYFDISYTTPSSFKLNKPCTIKTKIDWLKLNFYTRYYVEKIQIPKKMFVDHWHPDKEKMTHY